MKTSITIVERIATEAPASITILDKEDVEEQPGINLDDRLRSIPGFSLFRRSSGVVANPTTQGVSLRGLGSSGTSRTLILWDGIPINDPFGGWIYWTRIAPESIERVEVSRGASTSLFGDRAMSGAITLFSRPAEPRRFEASYEGGSKNTHAVGVGGSHVWSRFAASINARAVTTDGYYIVPEERRGAVDTPANVRFVTGDIKLDYIGAADRAFLKFDALTEDRNNGTAAVKNCTSLGNLSAHYSHEGQSNGISLLAYHTREQYHANFSAVSADRNTERITSTQTVPAEATGAAGYFRHTARAWNMLAGGDLQRVEGTSTDRPVPTGPPRVGGGSQFQRGIFAQTDFTAGPMKLFLGAREQFTGQDSDFFSPSAGLAIGRGKYRGRGTVYRSFRAPTLNELFREFRVGNAVTQANPALQPETMFGAEAGFDVVGESTRVNITLFRHSLDDLITNVTLSSTPQLITRQRRNAGAALTRGVDVDLRRTFGRWEGQLGYLFADSRFSTGLRIPQVPKHQGSAQLSYIRGGLLASAGLRSYSLQFEDDLNTFILPGFAVVQIYARQRLTRNLAATVAFENLLDREYLVGRSPTPLIGAPRLVRVGLRWSGNF